MRLQLSQIHHWEHSSLVECLPNMDQALGSMPKTGKKIKCKTKQAKGTQCVHENISGARNNCVESGLTVKTTVKHLLLCLRT